MFQLDEIEHPEYLEYVVTGSPDNEEWMGLIDRVEADCKRHKQRRVLVDVQGCDSAPQPMQRYNLGVAMGKTFSSGLRIAVQDRTENIDFFWETVAVNRGVKAKVSSKREVLLAWLKEED